MVMDFLADDNVHGFQGFFDDEEAKAIEDWRRRQERIPGVSASLRELVKLGLEHSQSPMVLPHARIGRRKATQ